jgi:hypothetical protein
VLPLKETRGQRGDSAQDLTLGVNDVPPAVDVFRARDKTTHDHSAPSLVSVVPTMPILRKSSCIDQLEVPESRNTSELQ